MFSSCSLIKRLSARSKWLAVKYQLIYIFTLIFKFGIESGKTYPQLTDRKDWIVIVDEAHRTQYKSLAENMRIALPNAQYISAGADGINVPLNCNCV